MAGRLNELFEINTAVAESSFSLRLATGHRLFEVGGICHRPHTAPAAAGDRLDHNRAVRAKRIEEFTSAGKVRRPFGAFNHRYIGSNGEGTCLRLVAKCSQSFGRRADISEAGGANRATEVGVFAQEAISRVDGVRAAIFGSSNDAVDVEIGRRSDTSQLHGIVGPSDVQRFPVVLCKNSGRLHADLRGGACDPNSNFATIGNE